MSSAMATEELAIRKDAQCLTFRIKDQTFGIDILSIKEILAYNNVTPIPLVPEFIKGILNLRGHVVPVIDVGRRFEWEKTGVTRMTCIVITELNYEGSTLDIGLMVDSVSEVVKLHSENVESSPNFGVNIRADFISNVAKISGKFVLLLNIIKLLDIEEIKQLRQIAVET